MSDLPALPENLPAWPADLVRQRYSSSTHGDYARWQQAVADLPPLQASGVAQYQDTVTFPGVVDADKLTDTLMQLHPWRKGPFRIGEVQIDTEWRSDLKWQRLLQHVQADGCLHNFVQGQRVLDIGCGNGYFGWRMLEAGAKEVIGIDPTLLFCMQHAAIQKFANDPRNWVLPLGIDEVPATTTFGAVFSMGVIYHRRDPEAHVQQMFALTDPGGTVVLESLVCRDTNLTPASRYARMRNVWCVPTPAQMVAWLENAGFVNCHILDITPTTLTEQCSTRWMHFESLREALDPDNPALTVEGYPAPVRALITGQRPSPEATDFTHPQVAR
ncbi:MAG: tRNA 5-methoxyuridine(34)/uridine 5-oxyacetic acid(34) synthase CmoB [Pseudomonadota bacterium]